MYCLYQVRVVPLGLAIRGKRVKVRADAELELGLIQQAIYHQQTLSTISLIRPNPASEDWITLSIALGY